jgi:hypothetical protein
MGHNLCGARSDHYNELPQDQISLRDFFSCRSSSGLAPPLVLQLVIIPSTPSFHVLPERCLSFLFDTSVPALFDFPDLHQGDFDRLVFSFFHRLLRRDVIFTVTAMPDF